MANVLFRPPTGSLVLNPNIDFLRQTILNSSGSYWTQGSGDADLEYHDVGTKPVRLLILPHREHGIYLKYIVLEGNRVIETWLSLYDLEKLGQVVECGDEWYASVG